MVRRNTAITYEDEFKKNPELKESDVQMLREWCAKQPHLPKISDRLLVLLLHASYYHIESTKTRIEMYCTMRTHLPEFFSNRVFLRSKELPVTFKNVAIFDLKNPTYNGYNIYYAKFLADPSQCSYNDCIKYGTMVCDLWFHFEGTRRGHVLVLNGEGLSMANLSTISLMGLKKIVLYAQDAMPWRVEGVHIINTIPFIHVVARMVKPFVKKEVFKKLHIHSTIESLTEFIPLDALPNEDGGKGGNAADLAAESIKWLEDNREWFQTVDETMRVNESLRPGKGKTAADLFGMEGSFKMLDID